MGNDPMTSVAFGQEVPDHFDSACFEIPFFTSANSEPSIISTVADRVSELQFPDSGGIKTDIAIFGNHNLAYYYWNLARIGGRLNSGATLIHLDAHPDIKSSEPRQFPPSDSSPVNIFRAHAQWLAIANFIGDATFSGLIDEYHWILPEWADESSIVGETYWSFNSRASSVYSPYQTIFFGHCINDETFEVLPIMDMKECERIDRPFLLEKSYLDSMPDISGKDVVLDVDLDWFCNSGWDSGMFLRSLKTECDRDSILNVHKLLDILASKGIRPASVTIATSPDYMFTDNADDVLQTLVKGLIEYGIVETPNILIGTPAYSMNIQYFARSLFNFVYDNMANDPRITMDTHTTDAFNSEIRVCSMKVLEESKGHRHNRVYSVNEEIFHPGEENTHDLSFTCQRGDYSQFISMAERYGLTLLGRLLKALERVQTEEAPEQWAIKSTYESVLYAIRPMMGHLIDMRFEPKVNF